MKTSPSNASRAGLGLALNPLPHLRLASTRRWVRTWFAFAAGLALAVSAQNFTVDWYTLDGGGGTSTGGVYSVSGTIGQPDAGAMSGGNYSLTGGFWALYAVQTPGAPRLSVWRTTTNTVVVSWPSPSTGFWLYQNTNVNSTNWVSPPETVNDDGTNKFIIVNPPSGNRFYRLKQP
jgi:hypothetical protein